MASEAPVGQLPPAPPVKAGPITSGPPKKGSGPPPSGYKGGIQVSKTPVQKTKELPVAPSPPTVVADKALLEAQKLAKTVKKPAGKQIDGGRSIKSVEIVLDAPSEVAAPTAEAPVDFFAGILGSPPPARVEEASAGPSIKIVAPPPSGDSANFFADKAEAVTEAGAENLGFKPEELPADQNEQFRQISEAVTSKLSVDPIKVHPDNNIFMPINRRGIHEFIIETYRHTF